MLAFFQTRPVQTDPPGFGGEVLAVRSSATVELPYLVLCGGVGQGGPRAINSSAAALEMACNERLKNSFDGLHYLRGI